MDPLVRELIAGLNGRLETFAHLNEKRGRSYTFEVEQIEGSLNDLLTALYSDSGGHFRTTRVAAPKKKIAAALLHWLFQFLDPKQVHLNDKESAFYFSDSAARRDYAVGLATELIEAVQPESVRQVHAEFPDDDEAEREEYALETEGVVFLVHLGVRDTSE